MGRLAEFLQTKNGRFSSMRLGWLTWVLGPFVIWAWLCIQSGKWEPIDENIWKVIAAAGSAKVASDAWSQKKDGKP